jgi:hypothetical protein
MEKQTAEEKPIVRKAIMIAMMLFGLMKILYFAFTFPAGNWIDWTTLHQIAIGCFYVFSGVWIYMTQPTFPWLWALLFLSFILELSQLGAYQSPF